METTLSKNSLTDKDFERKVLDIIDGRLMSVSQISKEMGVRRDVMMGYLEALKNQGKLEFHQVGKSNIYTRVKK